VNTEECVGAGEAREVGGVAPREGLSGEETLGVVQMAGPPSFSRVRFYGSTSQQSGGKEGGGGKAKQAEDGSADKEVKADEVR
jgi:hypothetical protein